MLPLAEYRDRQQRLRAAMAERGIDAVYLSFTPNLDYVAALPTRRRGATETRHPGDWLTGAFYTQNDELVVLSPRMDQRWVEPAVEAVPWVQELRIFGDQEDPAPSARTSSSGWACPRTPASPSTTAPGPRR